MFLTAALSAAWPERAAIPMLYGYLPSLLDGAWVTLRIAVFSLLLALVLGLIGASSRLSPNRLLRLPATRKYEARRAAESHEATPRTPL